MKETYFVLIILLFAKTISSQTCFDEIETDIKTEKK